MALLLLIRRTAAVLLAAVACGSAGAPLPAGAAAGPPDGTWSEAGPPTVDSDRSVFIDPVDGRVTLFRARTEGSLWKFDEADGGRWWRVRIEGSPPGTSLFYGPHLDRARRRLIAIGFNGTFSPTGFRPDTVQVWQLPLEGVRRWSRIPTGGTPPLGLYAPNITIDEAGGVLYLVGGTDEVLDEQGYRLLPRGETWTFDLAGAPTWARFPVVGPDLPGAYEGNAIFERAERSLVVYRALDSLGTRRESTQVWVLPVEGSRQWRSLGLLPEQLQYESGLHADPGRGLLGISVGNSAQGMFLRLHRLDVAGAGSWSGTDFPGDTGVPFPDQALSHQALDPTTGDLVIMGTRGTLDRSGPDRYMPRSDVWRLPGTSAGPWQRLSASLSPGGLRWFAPPMLDAVNDVVLAPTADRNANTGESAHLLWTVGGSAAWTVAFHAGGGPPTSRSGALSIHDPEGRRLLVYGGMVSGVEIGDLWELSFDFSPPRWRRILQATETPRPRHSASWVFDPPRRRAVMFGGFAGEAMQDTWELDLRESDPTWRRLDLPGSPPPARWDHSAIYDPRRAAMVVYGGRNDAGVLADTWSLSLAPGDGWVPVPIAGSIPGGRGGHAAVYDPKADRMIVLWGANASGPRFDLHALEFGSPARWEDFLPAGEGPAAASDAVALYDAERDRILVFGESRTLDGAVRTLEFDRPGLVPPPFPDDGAPLQLLAVGPNPSPGDVRIAFSVPRPVAVRLRLYDVRGRVVRDFGDRSFQPGPHALQWDGRGDDGVRLRDGVYFARLEAAGLVTTGKLVLMD